MTENGASRVFLLSPASTSGVRAAQISSPAAGFDCARELRSPEGIPVADAFAFLSSLYFRGKIAYARRFAASEDAIRVIAPGFGLVAPSWRLTLERLEVMKRTRVDLADPAYLAPMAEHAAALHDELGDGAQVVLLGSIATGKYVDVLAPALAGRLVFPRVFVGAGDMQRGSLMLRAARSGEELAYAPLDEPRHRRRADPGAAKSLTPPP